MPTSLDGGGLALDLALWFAEGRLTQARAPVPLAVQEQVEQSAGLIAVFGRSRNQGDPTGAEHDVGRVDVAPQLPLSSASWQGAPAPQGRAQRAAGKPCGEEGRPLLGAREAIQPEVRASQALR
jgi:hypothetical protein